MFMELAENLNKLSAMVTMNGEDKMSPKEIASLISNGLPDPLPDDVSALIMEPDGYDKLKMIAPKITEHEAWFKQLLSEFRALYSDAPPA